MSPGEHLNPKSIAPLIRRLERFFFFFFFFPPPPPPPPPRRDSLRAAAFADINYGLYSVKAHRQHFPFAPRVSNPNNIPCHGPPRRDDWRETPGRREEVMTDKKLISEDRRKLMKAAAAGAGAAALFGGLGVNPMISQALAEAAGRSDKPLKAAFSNAGLQAPGRAGQAGGRILGQAVQRRRDLVRRPARRGQAARGDRQRGLTEMGFRRHPGVRHWHARPPR